MILSSVMVILSQHLLGKRFSLHYCKYLMCKLLFPILVLRQDFCSDYTSSLSLLLLSFYPGIFGVIGPTTGFVFCFDFILS